MARPALFQNAKFRRLCGELGSTALALGTLELIWHSAYETGDPTIGDDLDVELAAQWDGERGKLVKLLSGCCREGGRGFITKNGNGVWEITDFWSHAPDYVRKRRQREIQRDQEANSYKGDRSLTADVQSLTAVRRHSPPLPSPSSLTSESSLLLDSVSPIRGSEVGLTAETGLKPTPTPAKRAKTPKKTDPELEWRLNRVWERHVEAWKNFCRQRNGCNPSRTPKLHEKDIRIPILNALKVHDEEWLGEDQRDEWEQKSYVKAAGVGIFYDDFMIGEDKNNDYREDGTVFAYEHWRPWKPQRGKPDPIPKFAELYFHMEQLQEN